MGYREVDCENDVIVKDREVKQGVTLLGLSETGTCRAVGGDVIDCCKINDPGDVRTFVGAGFACGNVIKRCDDVTFGIAAGAAV